MRGHVWTGLIAREMLPLIEYRHGFGRDVDVDLNDPEIPHTVRVAQMLSSAMSAHGVTLPSEDSQLLVVLERSAVKVVRPELWTVARIDGERVGIVAPGGVIESVGEHLTLVTSPEAGRYSAFYRVPGVWYLGTPPRVTQEVSA